MSIDSITGAIWSSAGQVAANAASQAAQSGQFGLQASSALQSVAGSGAGSGSASASSLIQQLGSTMQSALLQLQSGNGATTPGATTSGATTAATGTAGTDATSSNAPTSAGRAHLHHHRGAEDIYGADQSGGAGGVSDATPALAADVARAMQSYSVASAASPAGTA